MGRKGISITFYEKEGELEGLHVIEDKYDMKVNELSLDNMDVFEKTIKDSLAFFVCSFSILLNNAVENSQSCYNHSFRMYRMYWYLIRSSWGHFSHSLVRSQKHQ